MLLVVLDMKIDVNPIPLLGGKNLRNFERIVLNFYGCIK